MRPAAQLELKPDEYHDYRRRQRDRTLRALLAELERAREAREPWYVWVRDHWRAYRLTGDRDALL